MSDFTKPAIVRLLEANTDLRAKLALDSNPNAGGRPAIFNAWKSNAPKALPQLIFMIVSDQDRDLVDQAKGEHGVWSEEWHFQSWAKSRDDVTEQIMAILKRTLHNQRFALDGGATLMRCMKRGGATEGYDPDLDESFSIAIYDVTYAV